MKGSVRGRRRDGWNDGALREDTELSEAIEEEEEEEEE